MVPLARGSRVVAFVVSRVAFIVSGVEPVDLGGSRTLLLKKCRVLEASIALTDETCLSLSIFLDGESPLELLKILCGDLDLNPSLLQEG